MSDNQTVTHDENKVEESLEKGNKSYYFWSGSVKTDSVAPAEPKLLSKSIVENQETRPQVTLESYYWDEDSTVVKIYVPLEGVGKIAPANVTSKFHESSFELNIIDFNGKDYRIGLPNLAGKISVGESKHRLLANKVILVLKKINENSKWGFLRASVKA
eukprot:TRINITY_DN8712_c0_g1_i1.p1 TRINITY_DN8712_c0_g1~~TRINITY_DN8712_c0_g1_i1.p1  ORF type:complete len:159 (-),score=60.73 TRINITY_DN8712_c0_g1_i1:25-501(-)